MRAWKALLTFVPGITFLLFWEWFVHDKPNLRFLFGSPSAIAAVALADLGERKFLLISAQLRLKLS